MLDRQTGQTQTLLSVRTCGFESHRPHRGRGRRTSTPAIASRSCPPNTGACWLPGPWPGTRPSAAPGCSSRPCPARSSPGTGRAGRGLRARVRLVRSSASYPWSLFSASRPSPAGRLQLPRRVLRRGHEPHPCRLPGACTGLERYIVTSAHDDVVGLFPQHGHTGPRARSRRVRERRPWSQCLIRRPRGRSWPVLIQSEVARASLGRGYVEYPCSLRWRWPRRAQHPPGRCSLSARAGVRSGV